MYQQLDIDIVPPACTFIKSKIPAQVFFCEFCKFFQPVTYYKWDSGTGVFTWILRIFSTCNFVKSEILAQMFSCKFWEIFQPAALLRTRLSHRCFPVNLWKFFRTLILQDICVGLLLTIWSLLDSFVNFIVHQNEK